MEIHQYKAFILIAIAVLALIIAAPAIEQALIFEQSEPLTELYLLGPYHNATYPYNIGENETYRVYVNVRNLLGSNANYNLQVKFRNHTQSAPDSFNKTSSNQPALTTLSFSVGDNETYELPIDFSFQYEPDKALHTRLDMQNIIVNGATLNLNTTSIEWNTVQDGFFGNLIFEIWIFNNSTNSFQYHGRYVSLWLKFN